MQNPWLKKNPLMSMWLSEANRIAALARVQAAAQAKRQIKAAAGKAILDQVGKEIVDLNNRGVMAARSGDLEGAVKLLIQAAEQVPNLQFLVNAAKAIYTLMDQKGWDAELAARALDYLQRAQRKDRKSPKVASARHLYVTVAKKYGITTDNA